ncbi:hypothetical protein QVD17_40026 [Tagetes erecta]|uniref:SAM-dependent methyltransferase RsmB-F/NOP2-type catalytic core domain-containing protein n=1 Tax=Tagetes erecta TaxID=13708 RepID=A0AAD8JRI8_TARER|nr:hypothetical protein QVD17_40026 [Tagetes erecta]
MAKNSDVKKPRYVRVNTLKLDVETAMFELGKENVVQKDDMIPDLLMLPPDKIISPTFSSTKELQQIVLRTSVALGPKPGWEVIDACVAPGNKTVHLAALMKGDGKLVACEFNKDRVKRLEQTTKLAGATSILIVACASCTCVRPWINTKDIFFEKYGKESSKDAKFDNDLWSRASGIKNTRKVNGFSNVSEPYIHGKHDPEIEKCYEVINELVKEKEEEKEEKERLKGVIAELVTENEAMHTRMTNLEAMFERIVRN